MASLLAALGASRRMACAIVFTIVLIVWTPLLQATPLQDTASNNDAAVAALSPAGWMAKRTFTNPTPEMSKLDSYLAFSDKGAPLVTAPDTCAEVTLVAPARVDPAWQALEPIPVNITGIGDDKVCRRVLIPMQMRWGCSIRSVVAITVVVLAASHAGLNITTTDTIVQLVARIILFGPTMFLSVLILVAVTDARRRRRYRNLQDHTPVPPPDALASILSELLNAPAWEQHVPNSEWFDVL